MSEDRHAAGDEKLDGFGHFGAALQLHAVAAGFLHQAHGVAEGLFLALLVGAEGQVDDDAGARRAAYDGLAMGHHHIHRHTDGRVHA